MKIATEASEGDRHAVKDRWNHIAIRAQSSSAVTSNLWWGWLLY